MSDDKKVKNDAIEILLQSATVVKEKIESYILSLFEPACLENRFCADMINYIDAVFYDELQV